MTTRQHGQEIYAALRAHTRRLVIAAGGVDAAALITRAGKSSLSLYGAEGNGDKPNPYIPADVVADLEKDVGEPMVTRELARIAGFELVPLAARCSEGNGDPAHMVLRINREMGEFSAAVEDMDADGRRTPAELERCIRELDDVLARGRACRDRLEAMRLAAIKGA